MIQLSFHQAIRRARCLRKCDGVTSIEFAMAAPVLMLLMMGIIEFSQVMLVSNIMESSTNISARLGKTGYTTSGVTREQTIINSIKTQAGTMLNPNLLSITSKSYSQYDKIADAEPYTDTNSNGAYNTGEPYTDVNGNGQWDADQGKIGYGNAGNIVVYTVSYPWPIKTPLIAKFVGTNGIVTLISHAVVKNEPY